MSFDEAARQMALAYRNFLNPPKKISWAFASQRQVDVRKLPLPSIPSLHKYNEVAQQHVFRVWRL